MQWFIHGLLYILYGFSGNEDQARNQDNANHNLEGFVGRGYNRSGIDRVGVKETLKIEAVVMNPTEGGFLYEGPHYSHSDGFLYYVDIVGHKIGRYDTKADKNVWVDLPGESPTFIIPISGNTGKDFILGQGKRVVYVLVDWDLAKVVFTGPMYSPQHQVEDTRTNDGKCDPQGRLWFGTMTNTYPFSPTINKPRMWSLFKLEWSGGERVLDDVTIPNGLAWNYELGKMYYIDTFTNTVYALTMNATTGEVSNRHTVFNSGGSGQPHILDGMTIDTRGNLWIANFDGSRVIEVDPATKKIVSEIKFEDSKKITSVAFGGTDLDELYVTTALNSEDPSAYLQEAGAVYRITGLGEGVRGAPMVEF